MKSKQAPVSGFNYCQSQDKIDSVLAVGMPPSLGNGTAFLVARDSEFDWMMTCDHVRARLTVGSQLPIVGDVPAAQAILPSNKMDACILKVPKSKYGRSPLSMTTASVRDARCHVIGWYQSGHQLIQHVVPGTLKRLIRMRFSLGGPIVSAFELVTEKSEPIKFVNGLSGSPVLDEEQNVLGLLIASYDDSKRAICIDGVELNDFLNASGFSSALPDQVAGRQLVNFGKYDWSDDNPDDPNLSSVGHKPKADGFELSVNIDPEQTRNTFWFNATVRGPHGKSEDWGPVRFALHPSYERPIIWIWKIRDRRINGAWQKEARLEEVSGESAFTVVAQVWRGAGNIVELGFDLHRLPGLPKRFKWRK